MDARLQAVPSLSPQGVWAALRREAEEAAGAEDALASLLATVILNHETFGAGLSCQLARKLGDEEMCGISLRDAIEEAYATEPAIVQHAERDLRAVLERDPACQGYLKPFLFYKGFLALECHRVAHWLHRQGRDVLALHLQSRSSELLHVDIHPAARFGSAVFLDHGTSVVVGETTVIGDDVSILQGVTLGGAGVGPRGRHPTIGDGVLLSAGAKVLGGVRVGDNARIGAGSVVLADVPAGCTAVGAPARLVNCPACDAPGRTMDHA